VTPGTRIGRLTITEVRPSIVVCSCDCGATVITRNRVVLMREKAEPMCKQCRKAERKSFKIRFLGVRAASELIEMEWKR
jgi:hypothetical protein